MPSHPVSRPIGTTGASTSVSGPHNQIHCSDPQFLFAVAQNLGKAFAWLLAHRELMHGSDYLHTYSRVRACS